MTGREELLFIFIAVSITIIGIAVTGFLAFSKWRRRDELATKAMRARLIERKAARDAIASKAQLESDKDMDR